MLTNFEFPFPHFQSFSRVVTSTPTAYSSLYLMAPSRLSKRDFVCHEAPLLFFSKKSCSFFPCWAFFSPAQCDRPFPPSKHPDPPTSLGSPLPPDSNHHPFPLSLPLFFSKSPYAFLLAQAFSFFRFFSTESVCIGKNLFVRIFMRDGNSLG